MQTDEPTLEVEGYTVLDRIGHGGLGDVYRATRVSTGSTVAIKVLRDVSDASVAWNRTRRELTALVSLGGHAHVIRLLEVLEHLPGLVMEYAPGGSVAQLLDRRGTTLTVGEAVLIGRHTAAALAAAHDHGIVHRDVKPQNLLVDAFGQVKLCDFGIASLARTEEFRTRTSAISMRYASPEDLEEDAEVGPPADVYSLGATLLHLAHGAPPTLKERLAPWAPPGSTDPELAALDAILAACLQPGPAARPSAPEVLDRLESLDWQLADRRRAIEVESALGTVDRPPGHPDSPAVPVRGAVAPEVVVDRSEDATVYRTGRSPAAPPRPSSEPARRRRTGPVLVGLAAAAAIVVGVVVWTGDDATAPSAPVRSATGPSIEPPDDAVIAAGPSVVVVERPGDLVDLDDPGITWPLGSIAECLVQVVGSDRLHPVDCREPHDLQRFAVGALAEGTTSPEAPDDAELELAVADLCLDAAPPEWPIADIEIAQTNPSAASWADGDRGYQCLLGVPGHRLTGSALD